MSRALAQRFLRFVRRRRLMAPGDHVMVALSGGVDSLVLLHLLKENAGKLNIKLSAAHFDHAMRPASADDAEWVAGLCRAWAIPLVHERSRDALYGEAAARHARYEFLVRAAQQYGATRIATAHHADDQVETVLFRILRGTGLRGLAGIPVRRGNIIRPLLRFRKHELEQYAQEHDLSFRLDESNLSEDYMRNRIRRTVLPALSTVQASAPQAILALARHAARAERAWRSIIRRELQLVVRLRDAEKTELAREKLLEYDPEIRARVLRAELRRFGFTPDRTAVRNMLRFVAGAQSGSRLHLAGGLRLERAFDTLRITRPAEEPHTDRVVYIPQCGTGAAQAVLSGQTWHVAWTTSHSEEPLSARFACAQLAFPLVVRAWRAGDRMRLPYGGKKLKKLFAEARVPFNQRARVPVVVDAEGRVLWVAGVARSAHAPPVEGETALTITVSHG